jgi:hypothetical protein
MSTRIVKAGWSFSVMVVGDDLIVENTTATWFGGDNDPLDKGETASGVLTKGHPDLLGCSLPMDYQGPDAATRRAVGGSPIPMLPWGITPHGKPIPGGTNVIITFNNNSLAVPLIDNGPARFTKDGIDLTQATFIKLGGHLRQGVIPVSYRVLGGAKFIK